jgi:hypothetical protein
MNSAQSPAQQWLLANLVGYGAIELKKIYRQNLSRSFVLSVTLTLASVGIVHFVVWSRDVIPQQHPLRIIAYEEFVLPSSATALGMNTSLALPISEDNAFDPSTNSPRPKPKGTQLRKLALPHREYANSIGELPSLGAAERADRVVPETDVAEEGRSRIVGGGNAQHEEIQRGGNPALSSQSNENVEGGSRTGVGSATKPSPGIASLGSGNPFGAEGGTGGGGFSLEWLQGGTRKKISGVLPQYPNGVNIEAELLFYATVDPDGSIKAILPAQKADSRLERSVIEALREWKFEKLAPSFPQLEQTCLLKFIFQLK